ncbi:MAG: putative sulfate exporter family transporter [Elusimicrobia bacterium]|nr:putative sulfate exporter family transporter [Elusimicrobiota bacterium]
MTPSETLFYALLAFAFSPWASPPAALVLGVAFALLSPAAAPAKARAWTKLLLQASVVGLGFGMDLRRVLSAGAHGFAYTAGGIAFALATGWALGKLLKVEKTTSYLVSVGTAICGGSAIAAVGPVVGADGEQMSVALGTVFLLNSVALLLFPAVGHALGLGQTQFGLWSALAIHDTSSVVGACLKYGPEALAVGATVKLARALWIVPVCLVTAAVNRSKAEVQWPWFILYFVGAAAVATYAPAGARVWGGLNAAAKAGLTATLFLIGTGLSRSALSRVGPRPLIQGVALWAIVGTFSLLLIRAGLAL